MEKRKMFSIYIEKAYIPFNVDQKICSRCPRLISSTFIPPPEDVSKKVSSPAQLTIKITRKMNKNSYNKKISIKNHDINNKNSPAFAARSARLFVKMFIQFQQKQVYIYSIQDHHVPGMQDPTPQGQARPVRDEDAAANVNQRKIYAHVPFDQITSRRKPEIRQQLSSQQQPAAEQSMYSASAPGRLLSSTSRQPIYHAAMKILKMIR